MSETRWPSWLRRAAGPVSVVVAVLAANFPGLSGLVDVNPLGSMGRTGTGTHFHLLPGIWFTDPNIAWTSQPLGHLAALDWLHGIVPWWNPFEGLGAPLAAGMQSAALFPPTLLLALSNGQLYFHVTLEVAGGLATWYLARELGFSRPVATLAGILFALNGTDAWFGNAVVNPVCLLPVMLLGVERLARRRADGGRDDTGLLLLAAGLALSVYAGFPEVAYLDGVLVGLWFLLRLAGRPAGGRVRFALRCAVGGGIGLLLAAPLAVAFASYLPHADVTVHAGGLAFSHLPASASTIVGLPYLYGPIGGFTQYDRAGFLYRDWGYVGGYVTLPVIAMALYGLLASRRERALRTLLACVAAVGALWIFGAVGVQQVLGRILPLAGQVQVSRYLMPDIELAAALLACFGVEAAVRREPVARWRAALAGLGALATAAVVLGFAAPTVRALWRATSLYHAYPVVMIAWGVGGVVVAVVLLALSSRAAPVVIGLLLVVDALGTFGLPQLSAPTSATIDYGPARYLAHHLGYDRYFSLNVYHPDYGSYFGLASLDADDLPVPNAFARYVTHHLAPNANATVFDGARVVEGTHPNALEDLIHHLAAYEAVGVRYVLAQRGSHPFGMGPHFRHHVTRVYWDPRIMIFELPHARSFFSTSGGCWLHVESRDLVVAHCRRASRLTRLELAFEGWSATVDGRPATIADAGGLQQLDLPAGRSTVSFSYAPPHLHLALGLFGLGVVGAVGLPVAGRRRRSRRRRDPQVTSARSVVSEPAAASTTP